MNLMEAAEYIGTDVDTLLDLVDTREISCTRIFNIIDISKAQADEYLHSRNAISTEDIRSMTGASLCI